MRNNTSRYGRLIAALVSAVVLLTAACGGSTPEPKRGDNPCTAPATSEGNAVALASIQAKIRELQDAMLAIEGQVERHEVPEDAAGRMLLVLGNTIRTAERHAENLKPPSDRAASSAICPTA